MKIVSTIGAAAFVLTSCAAAAAMPSIVPATTRAPIVLVRDGCGPGLHLGARDGCVPNGGREYVEPREMGRRGYETRGYETREDRPREVAPIRLPPPCPRGYVRDPDPARPICYPRF